MYAIFFFNFSYRKKHGIVTGGSYSSDYVNTKYYYFFKFNILVLIKFPFRSRVVKIIRSFLVINRKQKAQLKVNVLRVKTLYSNAGTLAEQRTIKVTNTTSFTVR